MKLDCSKLRKLNMYACENKVIVFYYFLIVLWFYWFYLVFGFMVFLSFSIMVVLIINLLIECIGFSKYHCTMLQIWQFVVLQFHVPSPQFWVVCEVLVQVLSSIVNDYVLNQIHDIGCSWVLCNFKYQLVGIFKES